MDQVKKFVIAFLNLHEGELTQTIVESEGSAYDVAFKFLTDKEWEIDSVEYSTMKSLEEFCEQCDCWISVVEV